MQSIWGNLVTKCIFCSLDSSRIEKESDLFLIIKDLYPVGEGHSLLIPKRHVQSFFDLTENETASLLKMLREQKQELSSTDETITGYNVGINDGKDAGQTVMHCHIHLIPRRKGDMKDPGGGVRGVIPNKQKYYD